MKQNIIYFVADQMRADSLHHLGNSASITPHLDAVTADGLSFANAYCQNPVCVPSRCSFLTGLYPHTTGHRTMHFLQNADEPNILKEMKSNGYEVIWIGRNDVVPADRDKSAYCDAYFDGYSWDGNPTAMKAWMDAAMEKMPKLTPDDDRYYSFYAGKMDKALAENSYDWNCVRAALNYLDQKQTSDKPFFLYLTISYPHPPYTCEEPWYSSIDRNGLPARRPAIDTLPDKPSMLQGIYSKQNMQNWSEDRWNELRATYLAMVSRFDAQFGMLKAKLEETDLYDTSNLFVFSDHGDYTGDYGIVEKVQNCFENPIANVPLLIKPAKSYACQGRVIHALAELVDLSATVAEMAGFELSYTQFGKSLTHLFQQEETHKEVVLCEGGRIHGETQCMELGHGPESQYWPRLSTQGSEGPEHTKAMMIRCGSLKYTKRLYELDELYDLDQDPLELNNCINDPAYHDQLITLQRQLSTRLMETADFVPNRRDKR